jgi:hypothetical protein
MPLVDFVGSHYFIIYLISIFGGFCSFCVFGATIECGNSPPFLVAPWKVHCHLTIRYMMVAAVLSIIPVVNSAGIATVIWFYCLTIIFTPVRWIVNTEKFQNIDFNHKPFGKN